MKNNFAKSVAKFLNKITAFALPLILLNLTFGNVCAAIISSVEETKALESPILKTVLPESKSSKKPSAPIFFEENKGQIADSSNFVLRDKNYTLALKSNSATWYLPQTQKNETDNSVMGKIANCYEIYNEAQNALQKEADKSQANPLLIAPAKGMILGRAPNEAEETKMPTREENLMSLQNCEKAILEKETPENKPKEIKFDTLQMNVVGGNPNAAMSGVNEQTGKVNYYRGKSSGDWQTDVKTYSKVRAADVYRGIDAVYYTNEQRAVEYDFIVAPNADPNQIKLDFSGAKKLQIDGENGDLIIKTSGGEIRQHKPFIYQESNGEKKSIDGSFALAGKNSVKFNIGEYDKSKILTIDPTVVFATYLGGSGDDNFFQSFDSAGNIVGSGSVNSPGAPTGGANPRPAAGGTDIYIYKLSPSGQLIFATYFGGSGAESGSAGSLSTTANGLDGDLFIYGLTNSPNLPTTGGAGQATHGGGTDNFYARINIANGNLIFATYLGGSGDELTGSFSINYAQNTIYLSGQTPSTNFPMLNALQANYGGGSYDNFVSKMNLATGTFIFSTYIGGTETDGVNFVASDAADNIYLFGRISPPGANSFPISPNAFQPIYGGGISDNLYVKLTSNGALAASTYFGGSGEELSFPPFVFPMPNNSLRIIGIGYTRSTNFPRVNALQNGYGGGTADNYAVSMNENLTPLYSTPIGGSGEDLLSSGVPIFNPATNDYELLVYGRITAPDATPADNFPSVNAVQSGYGGGATDSALLKIMPNGAAGFSTYIGGAGDENFANSIGFDLVNGFTARDIIGFGRITAPDATPADNFTPTANAAQTTYGGGTDDAYFVRYDANNQLTGATFLGGAASESAVNLSIDNTVSPTRYYLGGTTASTNFPTVNAAQSAYGGGTQDLYLSCLNPNASFVFSTYLGGSGADTGNLLANVYGFLNGSTVVSGTITAGTSFPVTSNAVQTAYGGGTGDNFLTKLSPNGTPEVSTYVGGAGNETGSLFPAFDAQKNFLVSNTITTPDATPADNFRTTANAGQQIFGGGTTDGYAFKYSAANQLVYSTFVGGPGTDTGSAAGYAAATIYFGTTTATGYPTTPNAAQNTFGGGARDGVVTRINPNDGSFLYSTYVGGNGSETIVAIADAAANIYVYGTTDSSNLPVLNAFQTGLSTGGAFVLDGFYGKITPAGNYTFLSYLGGSSASFVFEQNQFRFINGRVYITGRISGPDATPADNFQPTNAVQSTFGGGALDQVIILLDDRFITSINANSVSDFDGDGRADASVFRNGTWFINPSSNPTALAPQGFYGVNFGLASDKLTPADYDGDGKTDIAVWRENSGNPDLSYFYILQSSNNAVRVEQFGRTGDDARFVGDWDGDGKADPAVYRASTNAFYYRPSATSATFVGINWGISGDIPLRGDFDGDGKLDAAVFRGGDWLIRQSSNNVLRVENWGLATDKFVPADYDGDGRTDLAVFRNGVWYVKQSSNNQPLFVNWGLSSDTLVPADYDGDGKADFAVWRGGVYYIRNSSSGATTYQYFGTAGDKPVAFAFVQ